MHDTINSNKKIEFSVHLVAKYYLAKQHESVQHWANANVDGACVCG